MLVRRHKSEGLVKHKNIINEFFSHPHTLFICKHHLYKIHMHTKKGSLGVPRILWVLTPSLCVTNPLTCNLWHFISFDLKTSYFWVLFVLFPFSLGNNKNAAATLVIDVKFLHSLIVMNLPLLQYTYTEARYLIIAISLSSHPVNVILC